MRKVLVVMVLVIVAALSVGLGQQSVGGCETHHTEYPC